MAKRSHVQSTNKLYFKGNLMGFQNMYVYENPRYGAPGSTGTSRSICFFQESWVVSNWYILTIIIVVAVVLTALSLIVFIKYKR